MSREDLLARVKLAAEVAGFIDVRVELEPHSICEGLSRLHVSGACPCGLGRSAYNRVVRDRKDIEDERGREWVAKNVYDGFKAHIEEDRKAGRWA